MRESPPPPPPGAARQTGRRSRARQVTGPGLGGAAPKVSRGSAAAWRGLAGLRLPSLWAAGLREMASRAWYWAAARPSLASRFGDSFLVEGESPDRLVYRPELEVVGCLTGTALLPAAFLLLRFSRVPSECGSCSHSLVGRQHPASSLQVGAGFQTCVVVSCPISLRLVQWLAVFAILKLMRARIEASGDDGQLDLGSR